MISPKPLKLAVSVIDLIAVERVEPVRSAARARGCRGWARLRRCSRRNRAVEPVHANLAATDLEDRGRFGDVEAAGLAVGMKRVREVAALL